MELSLEFGMPFERLRRSMSERELRAWGKYRRSNLLPTRRLEIYMAQLTCWVARSMGNKNVKIDDFLIEFDPVDDAAAATVDVQAIKDAMGFKPKFRRNRKK